MTHKHPKRAGLALLLAAILLLCGCSAAETPEAVPTEEPVPLVEEPVSEPIPEPVPDFIPEITREPVHASREPVGGEVTVSTVDELLRAIASDTTVYLEPGIYDLSAAADYGTLYEGGWYNWEEANDGYELVIDRVENLSLIGVSADEVTISAKPRYANVISFQDCNGVTLENITAGHTEQPGQCSGGVLELRSSDNMTVTGCGLYGCGILGIDAVDCRNLTVTETSIYECSNGAVELETCRDVRLENCRVYDCGNGQFTAGSLIRLIGCDQVAVTGSEVYGNHAQLFLSAAYSQGVFLLGSRVEDNHFDSGIFALKSYTAYVDGCSFRENETGGWYGESYDGADYDLTVSAPDGTPLTEEALAAMTLSAETYTLSIPRETPEETAVTEVHAGTVDELLTAIASDTVVYLDGGDYNLYDASDYGGTGSAHYYWYDSLDGPALVITGVSNFRIVGADDGTTTLLAEPRCADVLTFNGCENVAVTGITAGHTEKSTGCTGGVLRFQSTRGALVENCGLFGCGILGVDAYESRDIEVSGTDIYECSYGAARISASENVAFNGCDIWDCGSESRLFTVFDSINVTRDGESLIDEM